MDGISDIKIIGLDERRPPIVRKEPYIDLFFKLSHQAPGDWCNAFNGLMNKHPNKTLIKEKEGLYIETWVRSPDEVPAILDLLKQEIKECSAQYIERITQLARKSANANAAVALESGEQGRLNRIVGMLKFD